MGYVVKGAPEGSTGRLVFCSCFRRSPGSNLRPLVYKASDLSTAPRRLLECLILVSEQNCPEWQKLIFFFFFFFFLGETSTIGGCFCGFVVPGAPEGSTGRRF